MEDLSKPSVDVSDLGALEKEEEFTPPAENCDEYEKHQHTTSKEIIGNFVIGDIIGKGGFATVCKGLNLTTGEVVAVKKFERSKISPQQIGSVMYEVELLQRLTHENIVHILGKAESERHLYLFMEYMENGSMRGLLQSFGAFPEQLVAQFMEQVLHGLIYLHDAGVVHRDIKAANILLNRNNVKLADFGVAAELNENDRRYSVVGTPYWMAPEVIEITGHSLASDIWSVGCVVIEMVTGKPPYFHLNPMSAMFRIVQDPLPPLPKGISKDLETFLKCCFQKDPEHRLTARELLVHPWITHRTTNTTPVATSHEDIRNSIISAGHGVSHAGNAGTHGVHAQHGIYAQHGVFNRTERSDSNEHTIVHRGRGFDPSSPSPSPQQPHHLSSSHLNLFDDDMSSVPSLSRSSSFADATDRSVDCGECAVLRRALNEEKTKRQEILLTAINYIASSDAAREGGTTVDAQREFRAGLRSMLEEEFKLAFPDDNMPRFMQRRLTICNDQLPQIPPKTPPPHHDSADKKDRKKKEREEKEREEREKRERKEREKREKEERERERRKKESSFLTKDKKDPAKKKESTPARKEREKELEKEKEREREREKEKEKEKEKSWFA